MDRISLGNVASGDVVILRRVWRSKLQQKISWVKALLGCESLHDEDLRLSKSLSYLNMGASQGEWVDVSITVMR